MAVARICAERADEWKTLAVATYGMKKIRECSHLATQLSGRIDVDFTDYLREFMNVVEFFDSAVEASRIRVEVAVGADSVGALLVFGEPVHA